MKKDLGVYLEDILNSLEKIEEYTADIDEKVFSRNTQLQDAVMRRLTIMGEAVKHLPEELKKKYPAVPWKKIAGTRDVMIHEYSGVNLGRVWEAVKEDLPPLKKQIQEILQEVGKI